MDITRSFWALYRGLNVIGVETTRLWENFPGYKLDHHDRLVTTCVRDLQGLPCVTAVDVLTASSAPSGETTAEFVIPPASIHRDRVPKPIIDTVYDETAPWTLGICEVIKRTPHHLLVVVR